MMKYLLLFASSSLLLWGQEQVKTQNSLGYLYLILFIVTVGLFFWGVYKAVKTQKNIYAWALLPFILLMIGMFFI